jgi:NADPH2 dehydrogenase
MTGLFSPLKVKNFSLRNRIVLPPMANNMSDDSGAVTDAHIDHYVHRAEAGVGMVIVEHAYVRRDGRIHESQLGIHNDALIPGLRRLAEAVKACGAVVGVQINHGGGKASRVTAGDYPLAPSEGTVPGGSEPALALSMAQVAGIVEAFVAAARRALVAGFDFVEMHGAHGFLLSQFLSPLTNRRGDEYGGDLVGRLRMPLQVVKAVRKLVDDDHLLLYRLGANDFMPGGLTEEEGRQAAKALVAAGVDLLDISGGLSGSQPPDWDEESQGYFVPMAAAIRAEVDVPVVVAGGITDPRAADRFIRARQVDLVAIGRAMLTNPDWASEARAELLGQG